MLYEIHVAMLKHFASVLEKHTCTAYPSTEAYKTLQLPCVVLEMADFERNEQQPNDGRSSFDCRFEARIIHDPTAEFAEIHIRNTAVGLAHSLHDENYRLKGVGPAQAIQSYPDPLPNEFNESYLCWVVEFTHEVYVGDENAFKWPGDSEERPSLWIGFDPETGKRHESAYQEVDHVVSSS